MAVCDGELDDTWIGVAVPVFGAEGSIVAAIEVQVRDLLGGLATARTALGIAAACLSRDLAQAYSDALPSIYLIDQSEKFGVPQPVLKDLASQLATRSELA